MLILRFLFFLAVPMPAVRVRRVEKTAPTSINTNVKLFQSQFYP